MALDWWAIAKWIAMAYFGYVGFAITRPELYESIHKLVFRLVIIVAGAFWSAVLGALVNNYFLIRAMGPLPDALAESVEQSRTTLSAVQLLGFVAFIGFVVADVIAMMMARLVMDRAKKDSGEK